MFWKKKTNNDISIELASDDRRQGVRIKPLVKTIIYHGKYQSKIIDISSIGLSFSATETNLYKTQDGLEISIMLDPPLNEGVSSFVCTIKIIYIVQTSYHCQIIQIDRKNQNILDLFILNEQKRQIHAQSG